MKTKFYGCLLILLTELVNTGIAQNANQNLSNLTSPTAINQSLLPDINNSKDLGLASNSWRDLYLDGIIFIRDTPSMIITTALGTNATIVGSYAGNSNTGNNNYFYGTQSGYLNTTDDGNSFFGDGAGFRNTTGSYNSFFGESAGYNNTIGNQNTMLGSKAGYLNEAGGSNTIVGAEAGYHNNSGDYNSFFGESAGYNNTTGNQNTMLGSKAGYENISGTYNCFFGANSGLYNTEGSYNSFFGGWAGIANTTGILNICLGYESGYLNDTGKSNTIVGAEAGYNNRSDYNCFFGNEAGYNTTGNKNTMLGYHAGNTNTTGSSNTIIGYGADVTNAKLTNSAAIGNLATVSASNTMVLGNSSESVVIGAHAPATGYKLSVNGKIICEELKVQLLQNWPDYVFNKNYHLMPLDDLNKKIQSLHHLPNIPSADEVKKDGVSVGDMQQLMMQKIEELTLYVIQLQKQNTDLQKQVNEIKTGK